MRCSSLGSIICFQHIDFKTGCALKCLQSELLLHLDTKSVHFFIPAIFGENGNFGHKIHTAELLVVRKNERCTRVGFERRAHAASIQQQLNHVRGV